MALLLAACSATGSVPSSQSSEGSQSIETIADEGGSSTDGHNNQVPQQQTENTHVDEFAVVEAHAEQSEIDKQYGYFELVITAKNNTDQPLRLQGIKLSELDAGGNIINSYSSENKNAVDALVEPGQQISIPLTCREEDDIAGIQCTGYTYKTSDETIEGSFSEIFKQMF